MSLNTDDPALLGTSLEHEYSLCQTTFNWSDEVVKSVARTSINASFAGDGVKRQLLTALDSW